MAAERIAAIPSACQNVLPAELRAETPPHGRPLVTDGNSVSTEALGRERIHIIPFTAGRRCDPRLPPFRLEPDEGRGRVQSEFCRTRGQRPRSPKPVRALDPPPPLVGRTPTSPRSPRRPASLTRAHEDPESWTVNWPDEGWPASVSADAATASGPRRRHSAGATSAHLVGKCRLIADSPARCAPPGRPS